MNVPNPSIAFRAKRGADDDLKFQLTALSRMPLKQRDVVSLMLERSS